MSKDLRWEKQTIVKTEEVDFAVMEPQPGKYLVHCNVHEWSPSIYREFLKGWGSVVEEFYKNGIDEVYALIPIEHENKIGKFAEMFGFHSQKEYDVANEDGEEKTLVLYKFPIKETVEN